MVGRWKMKHQIIISSLPPAEIKEVVNSFLNPKIKRKLIAIEGTKEERRKILDSLAERYKGMTVEEFLKELDKFGKEIITFC